MDYHTLSKEELIAHINELENKPYGLVWEKREEFIPQNITLRHNHEHHILKAQGQPTHTLIEGENLYALTLLKKHIYDSLDVICFVPPYFTRNNDLRYTDNFSSNKKNQFKYSEWINFMYHRLVIAKDLLKQDGFIAVHIDEKMHPYLQLLMNDIFGESNFVSDITWQNKYGRANDKKTISSLTEYILIYAKNQKNIQFARTALNQEYVNKTYKNHDNDKRGAWRTSQLYKDKNQKSYKVTSPCGVEWEKPWNVTPETFVKLAYDNRIWWGKDGTAQPRKKIFLAESNGQVEINLWTGKEYGYVGDGKTELEKWIPLKGKFLYPKPVQLEKKILSLHPNKNAKIMDFFAGSGTLGQAVMELNEEDGGKRECLLITNNENNIFDEITYPRLRNVIESRGFKENWLCYHLEHEKDPL
ncbi:site-specific DNA-methyltransferase (plasmid) [Aneurinibacillus sp. Ricciae_BoGa-3]|uniref:site-specific DNA-methyltransferase n=1 Tax=Aneurinibacillus sp. Ricciae_BoGa-3 TaxID=3022697 RepID=UPI0023405196|nr:site-specific DNA-methyltransferase [Aneurinibacillus sp. Ricciae_BoGa-3]WCK57008.1 site-specific DNA-methyltransferase [Aneurinibacillus sp. Ricciae_BoGa-3]